MILNMASSIDGRIALRGRKPLKLSSEEDFARVHQLRSECQAILVGVETVIADDPKLTVKRDLVPEGRDPLRIVLDSRGRLPPGSLVLDGTVETLVVTAEECTKEFPPAEVVRCGPKLVDLPKLLRILSERGVEKLLVEGGGTVAWSFLREGLVDLVHVYVAPVIIADGETPSLFKGNTATTAADLLETSLKEVTVLGGGVLLTFRPKSARGSSSRQR